MELKDAEKKSVLKNKILLTQYRYFAKLISVFALKGDLTHEKYLAVKLNKIYDTSATVNLITAINVIFNLLIQSR